MKYSPESKLARLHLETVLCQRLEDAGFTREFREGTKEMIFSRAVRDHHRVLVYTGCTEGRGARGIGKDAIRVCGILSHNGRDRGLCKAKRVNRTGNVDDIAERMVQRMREVWREVSRSKSHSCPSCGAPQFLSKNDNWVCADLCWQRPNWQAR